MPIESASAGCATALEAPPLGLYVHLPWCVRKCPYCDFNSHTAPTELPVEAYLAALLADLAEQAPAVAERPVRTVFLGGGTPSLLPPEAFAALLAGARERVSFAEDVEVTLEVNPGTVEHAPFAGYRQAGIDRVSLGVQSFADEALRRLGRIHGGDEARRAVAAALDAGFASVNVDLMFALAQQSVGAAVADVRTALALGAPHVSHYQLTIEPNTLFHAHPPALPDADLAWDIQDACHAVLAGAGLEHYEVSAWARPGHRCRHNVNYWSFGDYLGIGAGAHGKVTDPMTGRIRRTLRRRHPRAYLARPAGPGAFLKEHEVAGEDRLFELALNVFRLREGVPRAVLEQRLGGPLELSRPPWREAIARELVTLEDGRVRPTALGFRHLNALQALFLP